MLVKAHWTAGSETCLAGNSGPDDCVNCKFAVCAGLSD